MARDDLAFAAILVGSVLVSAALRYCPARIKADAAALCGALTILGACGPRNALHPLTSIALALAAMHMSPPRYHKAAAFVLSFGYLSYVRLLPSSPGGPTNACMLLMTLRLSTAEAPSTAELLRYVCCYHGLFTGPYYSHAEWDAAMRQSRPPHISSRALTKASFAAVGALIFWRLVASQLPYRLVAAAPGGDDAARVDVWITRVVPSLHDEAAFWTRLLYFYASSYQFRWRFYTCWLIMTISATLLGFAETSNVDLRATELATSPSMYITGWNTSVQRWLKDRVYRQLPQRTPRAVRMLATFAVSAVWHGVHLGYALFFAGLFVMVGVEQMVRLAWGDEAAVGDGAGGGWRAGARRVVSHVWTMGCFSFYGGAFNLLGWRETLHLWRALHFYGIWLAALPALPAALRLWARRRASEAAPKAKET